MNGVVNDVVVICSDVLLCLKPINIVSEPFWVIGGLKLGFWMNKRCENRRFLVCPDEFSLKRDSRRSSEWHFCLPRIVSRPFAQAIAKRTPSERNPNLRHLRRSSEIPVAQAKAARTCCMWASLKRTPSEPQARTNQTYVFWLAQARLASLKRDWSWTTILCNFLRCSKPKPKLPNLFIRFIKSCLDGKNYIMKMIKMELCMLMCK